MIERSELTQIGTITKPHGINGELNALVPYDIELDSISCLVFDVDGIFVPFYISGLRRKGTDGYLLRLDDVTSEEAAAEFRGKTIFALTRETPTPDSDDEDGLYADDLVGFKAVSEDNLLNGEIIDLDTSTENILFVIKSDTGKTCLIPVVDEFITEIDAENKIVTLDLPDGLLDL